MGETRQAGKGGRRKSGRLAIEDSSSCGLRGVTVVNMPKKPELRLCVILIISCLQLEAIGLVIAKQE